MARRIIRPDGYRLAIPSEFDKHIAAHPDITDALLAEAFGMVDATSAGWEISETVDLGRVIGVTSKVQTEPVAADAPCLFGYRHGRRHPSRTVLGVEKPATSRVTIAAERVARDCFVLRTAYLGDHAPPEPTSFRAIKRKRLSRVEVLAFWCRHALIHDPLEFASEPFESTWASIIGEVEAERIARKQERPAPVL